MVDFSGFRVLLIDQRAGSGKKGAEDHRQDLEGKGCVVETVEMPGQLRNLDFDDYSSYDLVGIHYSAQWLGVRAPEVSYIYREVEDNSSAEPFVYTGLEREFVDLPAGSNYVPKPLEDNLDVFVEENYAGDR